MKRSMLKRGKPLNRKRIRHSLGRAKTERYQSLRVEVYIRDQGRCVLCREPVPLDAFECHHRLLRKHGGRDEHVNCITLCSDCHHGRVHAFPNWSRDNGFIVPSWAAPELWPVNLAPGDPVFLAGDWWLPGPSGWGDVDEHPDQQANPHPLDLRRAS